MRLAMNRLRAWQRANDPSSDSRALRLASMPRDPCEVGVVTRVPAIDGQPTCEFVNLFQSVLMTRGYDARLARDHADRVDVSTCRGSGHKHVACPWGWPARHRRDGHRTFPLDCRARLAHARSGFFSCHSIVYLRSRHVGARCGPNLLRIPGALTACPKHEASRGFHIESEPFSLKRSEVASASCGRHMDVSKSLGCRQFSRNPNPANPLARELPLS